ncbi:hypothetical protein BUALT_BualtUnG0053500 [Buddleja alternifolia]|uniref:Uncharacterized protein n=1 Tax=Buddleja alternifolia TaxID=168488 RepID=A0AAV6W2Z5_9LAMI|nr:hypothetical protein BUALT_BualtUnG0053500 [Buddleja alternifolia]
MGENAKDIMDAVNGMMSRETVNDMDVDLDKVFEDIFDDTETMSSCHIGTSLNGTLKNRGKKRAGLDCQDQLVDMLGEFVTNTKSALEDLAHHIGYDQNLSPFLKWSRKWNGLTRNQKLHVSRLLVKNDEDLELFTGLSDDYKVDFVKMKLGDYAGLSMNLFSYCGLVLLFVYCEIFKVPLLHHQRKSIIKNYEMILENLKRLQQERKVDKLDYATKSVSSLGHPSKLGLWDEASSSTSLKLSCEVKSIIAQSSLVIIDTDWRRRRRYSLVPLPLMIHVSATNSVWMIKAIPHLSCFSVFTALGIAFNNKSSVEAWE